MGKEQGGELQPNLDNAPERGREGSEESGGAVFDRNAQTLQGSGTAEEQGSRDPPGTVFNVANNSVARRMSELEQRAAQAEAELERQRELRRARKKRWQRNHPEEYRREKREGMQRLRDRKKQSGET